MHHPTTDLRVAFLSILAGLLAPTAGAQSTPPSLPAITVVGSPTGIADSTRTIQIITREQIAMSTARTVADVLASLPGIDLYTRSPAQGDLSIRGSTSDQVVVLVDGQRVSDVQSSHYDLDLAVPLADVERIEVLRGPASAVLGPGAIGGAVNIVTRDAAASGGSLHGGSFGVVGGSATSSARSGSTTISAAGDFDKSDGHRDGTDYRIGEARLDLTNPLGTGRLRTSAAVGIRNFGANAFYGPYDSYERTGTQTLRSRWDASFSDWSLSAAAGTRRHSDDYVLLREDPSVYENHHYSWQTTGEIVGRTIAGPLGVALGGDVLHDQLSSARLGGRREWRAGAFVEGTLAGSSPLMLSADMRVDRSSSFGAFFSRSLGATARVGSHLRLRATTGTGFRLPTWTERYYTDPVNQGDSTLRAEHFRSAELGATLAAAGFTLDVAGWARDADNLIDWVRPIGSPDDAVWHAINIGNATYRGLDGELHIPAIAGVTASLFATGLRFTDDQGAGVDGKYALRPITRDAGLRVVRSWSGTIEVGGEAIEARRAREGGHLTGNVHLAWIHRSLRISLDAVNVANADWLDASGEPVPGRSAVASIGWTASRRSR